MHNLHRSILCILFTLLLILGGCAAPAAPAAQAPATESATQLFGVAPETPKVDSASGNANQTGASSPATQTSVDFQKQKIIRNATLTLETKAFDATIEGITQNVNQCGGYVETSVQKGRKPQNWNEEGRAATLTARIPVGKLDEFLSASKNLANVVNETISSENVSEHYYDITARKKAYSTQLEHLLELVAKAEKLEDILTLETEISRLQYEIEAIDSKLRYLDSQVAYSTALFTVRELTDMSVPQAKPDTFGDRLNQSFIGGLKSATGFIQNFTLVLVSVLPSLLVLAILALIVYLLVRLVIKIVQKQQLKKSRTTAVMPAVKTQLDADVSAKGKPETKTEKEENKK